ncbi:ECF transporter S component [Listeria ivanovii]|uniref:ECF transporter S component n=1 Tax=Listeria ivanovii (strain ATCC BAA-678 / PAM 55) TaxID=881621 RepID=G2Z9U5_LISIP|nr:MULTISPECIES: hypothetical protein [Listeria]OET37627.1 ECF transporter S component [Listeria monocytogenes]AHI54583.1 histidine kinase [Listeria ivanovii WSLC3009]AIS64060.1 histidine kinase [Listeria ivanovii subsp. ivanovii]EAF5657959.1 ECF transporter S component [Listeria innocua]EFR92568.1 signal transduction histidine kinase, LytS [Listeria innocua FSL J1-023]
MKRGMKYDFSLLSILLIPIGVAINVVGYQLSSILKLPVFLDLMGTAMVSMIAGPWVGLVTGGLGSLVNGMLNPVAIPFALVSMSVGWTVGMLSRAKMFNNLILLLISSVIVTIVSSITSAPVQVIMFGGVTGSSIDLITATILSTGQQIWTAVFSQTLIIGSINSVVNLLIAWLIVKKMSARYLSKQNYGMPYIKKQELNTTKIV